MFIFTFLKGQFLKMDLLPGLQLQLHLFLH